MSKYKKQNNFSNTFKHARKGVRLTLRSEKNLRIHLLVATLVIASAYCLHFSVTKFCILLLTVSAVLSAEMFNSAIEFSLDAIFHNRYSRMVGMAKDIAAGAVLVVTITSVLIGALLFAPPVIGILAKI